jgi:hypothetical protein
MIKSKTLEAWLLHRYGKKQLDESWIQCETKALELNSNFNKIKTFGKKDFYGFVGFIDLVGFSSSVKGKAPSEVANFILPFLNDVCKAVTSNNGMIDKTIGDEIMFVIPDISEEEGVPPILSINSLIGSIKRMKGKYSFRFGLSYGKMYLGRVIGGNYKEWSVFGESINLSKRLVQDKQCDKNIGLFAILNDDRNCYKNFNLLKKYLFVCHKFEMHSIKNPIKLKGISEYKCFSFSENKPKPDQSIMQLSKMKGKFSARAGVQVALRANNIKAETKREGIMHNKLLRRINNKIKKKGSWQPVLPHEA